MASVGVVLIIAAAIQAGSGDVEDSEVTERGGWVLAHGGTGT